MAVQHLIAFLSGVLQGRHLGRVLYTTPAVFWNGKLFFFIVRLLLVLLCSWCSCSQTGLASKQNALGAAVLHQTALLLLLAPAGAWPCAKQSSCRRAYDGLC